MDVNWFNLNLGYDIAISIENRNVDLPLDFDKFFELLDLKNVNSLFPERGTSTILTDGTTFYELTLQNVAELVKSNYTELAFIGELK